MRTRPAALALLGGAAALGAFGIACSDRGDEGGARTSASKPASAAAVAKTAAAAPAEPSIRTASVGTIADAPLDGAQLYAQHCALCHGISGDGQGQQKLDPPARSFQEGKFSFGNTPEQLFKTITAGIPGRSPMPAFELVLSEPERREIVKHLATLMPIEEHASVESTEMIVLGKTQFARGFLPPIAEGKAAHPRGLLVGRPEGLTFEYRIDDVRLLGVRMGRFAARHDWGGRGGDALEPLGRVIALVQGGDPDPTFRSTEHKVSCAFLGTWVRGDESILEFELYSHPANLSGDPPLMRIELGRFEESVEVIALREGTGFERRWRATSNSSESLLLDPLGSRGASASWSEHAGWWWSTASLEDGTTMVTAVHGGASEIDSDGQRLFRAVAAPKPDEPSWRCATLIASAWDDARRDLVAKALAR